MIPKTNTSDNLYLILDIESTSSQEQIKSSYKKLILKWHPDKNLNNQMESEEKFRNIQLAYEVLGDPIKRKEYDNMTNGQKIELFDTLKDFFLNKYPSLSTRYTNFLNSFYQGNENELRENFDSFNFKTIYENVIDKVMVADNFFSLKDIERDITITTSVTLLDKYKDNYIKIHIHRKTKHDFIGYVRAIESQVIFNDDGEIINGIAGNLIVNIICPSFYDGFRIIDDDLYSFQEISIYQYLYGGIIEIKHIDNTNLQIEIDNFIDKAPMHIFKNMGLIIENEERSDFVIYFKIKNINEDNFKLIIKSLE